MSEETLDSQVDKAMEILGPDLEKEEAQETPAPVEGAEIGATEEPTEELKTNNEDGDEVEALLEPPASWRSDEKELFKNLPREAQEVALRLQQAQDSHFTQRSTELAQARRAADDERHQYQAERARYAQELMQFNQLASQLLPAKFSDIQSEADFLRLKASPNEEDRARASEYEVFKQILNRSMQQTQAEQANRQKEHLNREWSTFVAKYPEYQDTTKATAMLTEVRKAAVEYYGFSPQEVQVIPDHRQIPVLQDALKWRQFEANRKAMAAKKMAPTPKRVIQPTANTANPDGKSALLNRARKSDRMDDKVDAITAYLSQLG